MKSFFQRKNELDNPFFVADVVSNNDPTGNYRIKVRIPEIHHDIIADEQLPWAAKLGSSFLGVNGSYNSHSVPEVGSKVLILSIGNDLNSLVYIGILCKKQDSTPSGDGYGGTFGIYTASGEFIGVDKITKTLQLIYEGHINVEKIIDAEIKVSDKISVICPKITITGDVDIKGNVNINGKNHVTGQITSDTEVQAKSVTLTGHTHPFPYNAGPEPAQGQTQPGQG
jgi:phage baseplate assembly protein V